MWVATDTLLENLGEAESAQIDYIAFLSDSSEILDNRPFFQDSSRLDVEKDRITLSRRHYVITQSHTQSGTFSLIGLVDEQKVLNSFNTLYYTILFFSLILLGLMVTFLILLHKSILAPLQSLAETIKSIRQGNFQAAVNPCLLYTSFIQVDGLARVLGKILLVHQDKPVTQFFCLFHRVHTAPGSPVCLLYTSRCV